MYQLTKNQSNQITGVFKTNTQTSIPFAPDNTDYQTFKKDLAEGASLKDAESNDMTAEQITTFLGTLT
jgi:hypothetical protein